MKLYEPVYEDGDIQPVFKVTDKPFDNILSFLNEHRIFNAEIVFGKLHLIEACDDHFDVFLDIEQVDMLIKELEKLKLQMEQNSPS